MGFALNVPTPGSARVCTSERSVAPSGLDPQKIMGIIYDIRKALIEALLTNQSTINGIVGACNPMNDGTDPPNGVINQLHEIHAISTAVMQSAREIRDMID